MKKSIKEFITEKKALCAASATALTVAVIGTALVLAGTADEKAVKKEQGTQTKTVVAEVSTTTEQIELSSEEQSEENKDTSNEADTSDMESTQQTESANPDTSVQTESASQTTTVQGQQKSEEETTTYVANSSQSSSAQNGNASGQTSNHVEEQTSQNMSNTTSSNTTSNTVSSNNTVSSDTSSNNTASGNTNQSQMTSNHTVQPTQKPTQPATQVVTEPVTECQHINQTKKVVKQATATENGRWGYICDECGIEVPAREDFKHRQIIHAYSAYSVDLGGGQTATVYGYYDEQAAELIFQKLNTYRAENGLDALENRFHEEANVRAIESAYDFTHDRPNGNDWNALNEKINGENLAARNYFLWEPSESVAELLMSQWKKSYGHNLNMLTGDELVGTSVFIRMELDNNGVPTSYRTFGVQLFGTDADIWDF